MRYKLTAVVSLPEETDERADYAAHMAGTALAEYGFEPGTVTMAAIAEGDEDAVNHDTVREQTAEDA